MSCQQASCKVLSHCEQVSCKRINPTAGYASCQATNICGDLFSECEIDLKACVAHFWKQWNPLSARKDISGKAGRDCCSAATKPTPGKPAFSVALRSACSIWTLMCPKVSKSCLKTFPPSQAIIFQFHRRHMLWADCAWDEAMQRLLTYANKRYLGQEIAGLRIQILAEVLLRLP